MFGVEHGVVEGSYPVEEVLMREKRASAWRRVSFLLLGGKVSASMLAL